MGRLVVRGGIERARTLTVAEVCEVLACSRWTVRRYEEAGRLRRVPTARAREVRYYVEGVLVAYVRAHPGYAEGPPPGGGGPSW